MVSTEVLKEFRFFEGLDDSELAKIAGVCHERTRNEGDLFFVQGRKATELHLCRSGKVMFWFESTSPGAWRSQFIK